MFSLIVFLLLINIITEALEFYVGTSCGLAFVIVQEERWGTGPQEGSSQEDAVPATRPAARSTAVLMFELVEKVRLQRTSGESFVFFPFFFVDGGGDAFVNF